MPNKRQKVEAVEEVDESSSESYDEQSGDDLEQNDEMVDPNEEIQIDFEARSPTDTDYESIKLLLNQKLATFSFNLGEMTEMLIGQSPVGNVIYQAIDEEPILDDDNEPSDADETIFGIMSAIDLRKNQAKGCIQQLVAWLSKLLDKEKNEFFKDVFKKHRISLVVNERYLNIPAAISVPMFESLLKDLHEEEIMGDVAPVATSSSSEQASSYWLFLSRIIEEDNEKVYANPEEEIIEQYCEGKIQIKYPNNKESQVKSFLNVFFVEKNKLTESLNKLKEMFKQ